METLERDRSQPDESAVKRTLPLLTLLLAFTAFAAGLGTVTLGKVEAKLKLAFASRPNITVVVQYQGDDKDSRAIAKQVHAAFRSAGFTAVDLQKMENDTAPKMSVTIDNLPDSNLQEAARLLLSAVGVGNEKLFLYDNATAKPAVYVRVGPQ